MTNRITLQPSFVLHTKPYRDTSLIVDLFTLNHGRVRAVARSARGLRSRFKNQLRPFIGLLTTWSGKSDLVTLSQAETHNAFYDFEGNTLISGLYLNELLVRTLHLHDPQPELFVAYQKSLAKLMHGEDQEKPLRLFEKTLLSELGYALVLTTEAESDIPIKPDLTYTFSRQLGFFRNFHQHPDSEVFKGSSLLAFDQNQLDDVQVRQECKRLMRIALAPLLGEKPIQTRELFV